MTKLDWDRHKRAKLPEERKSRLEILTDRYLEEVDRRKAKREQTKARRKGKR